MNVFFFKQNIPTYTNEPNLKSRKCSSLKSIKKSPVGLFHVRVAQWLARWAYIEGLIPDHVALELAWKINLLRLSTVHTAVNRS